MPHDDKPNETSRGFASGYSYVGMGFSFALAMLLFGAGGWVVDGWLHTRPLFFILGALFGGFAGFMSIYYRVKKDVEKKKHE